MGVPPARARVEQLRDAQRGAACHRRFQLSLKRRSRHAVKRDLRSALGRQYRSRIRHNAGVRASIKSSPMCTTPCASGCSVAQPRLARPTLRREAAVSPGAARMRQRESALATGGIDVANEVALSRVQHLHCGVQVVAHPPQVQHAVAGVLAVDALEVWRVSVRVVQLAVSSAAQKHLWADRGAQRRRQTAATEGRGASARRSSEHVKVQPAAERQQARIRAGIASCCSAMRWARLAGEVAHLAVQKRLAVEAAVDVRTLRAMAHPCA
jgi:hypothetical protein